MSDQPQEAGETNTPKLQELPIHFRDSKFFRVIQADAVWLSLSPHKQIHLIFYNDKFAAPDKLVLKVDSNGMIGESDKEKSEMNDGIIVREMEVDVSLTQESLRQLYDRLHIHFNPQKV